MLKTFIFVSIIFLFAFPAYAGVVINEVAWMGTAESASNEWIELYSDTAQSLGGCILATEDGGMKLQLKGTTTAGGYFLIERTDDNSIPEIKADLISAFGKGLSNDGEILILKDAGGNIVDRADGSGGWAIGGDNDSKYTLQRNSSAPKGWLTAVATPKAKNADYVPPKPKSASTAPLSSKSSGKKSDFPGKSDFKEGDFSFEEGDFPGGALATDAGSTGEYVWLLGGILGGAVLGLLCVIIAKWKKSP